MEKSKDYPQTVYENKKPTLAGLFSQQAEKTPDHPAVSDDHSTLSYEQLNLAVWIKNNALSLGREFMMSLPAVFEKWTRFSGVEHLKSAGAVDLALQTGAPVIPAFPNLRDDGIIEVEFLAPLIPALTISRSARIDSLLEQYADIYVSRWPQMLPNMTFLWQRLMLVDTTHSKMK
jgi:hypothetical protein